ncbi:uncharacterized protein LOC118766815 [Octopus sinensis]|uniref:Uncharacterized protein LOC118766815 n=1 Tax=Octopus sinensis TaxID=2607531 RepID=A0A7E6FFD8_9MOLL|nr:uncharacterized protein LOC118766815 [Octopus sinensis]
MQNNENAVLKFQFSRSLNSFQKEIQRNGFDCTSILGYRGQIICWKFNPTCKDATTYTFRSATESSKPKTLKARSFLKSLDVLNLPIEVNKTLVFRCVAYIAAPTGINDILWFERGYRGTHMHIQKIETRPTRDCLSPVVSFHNYTVKQTDIDFTNITCFLNGETLTKLLIKSTGSKRAETTLGNS